MMKAIAVLLLVSFVCGQDDLADYPIKEEQCTEFPECLQACVNNLPPNRQFTEILDCSDACALTHCKEVVIDDDILNMGITPEAPAPPPPPPINTPPKTKTATQQPPRQQQQQQQQQPPKMQQQQQQPPKVQQQPPAAQQQQQQPPVIKAASPSGASKTPSFSTPSFTKAHPSKGAEIPSFGVAQNALGQNLLADSKKMKLKQCHPNLGLILFNPLDTAAGKSLDNYGEWSRAEQDLIGQVLRPGDYVVDAGSLFGTSTMFLARIVGPQGRAYAFEVQRHLQQITCGNAALNGLSNVHCELKAVGNKEGEITVPTLDFDAEGCHGCTALDETNFLGEKVDVVTIDSLNLPRCRLIKLDIEGMELAGIQGAQRTITTFKPAIYMRAYYNRQDNLLSIGTQRAAHLLQTFNYDMYWHFSPRYFSDNHFKNAQNVFEDAPSDLFILAVPHVDGSKIEGLEPVVVPPDVQF